VYHQEKHSFQWQFPPHKISSNFAVGDVSVFVPLQDLYTALESLKMEYGIIYQEDITIFFI